jgi:amino acid adenylation domain-containing protein
MERGRLGLLHLEFNTDLFDQATMQRMEGHLLRLLAGAVADPEQRLSLLPMLSAAEEHQLRSEGAEAIHPPHPGRCPGLREPGPSALPPTGIALGPTGRGGGLHDLFAAQARQRPEAVALASDSLSLTYAELERRANALAHHLRTMGIGPEARVGLCVERGPEMIIGLLGILKAGGAYVPLDPSYPAERLSFLLDDALGGQASPVVLVGEGLTGRVAKHGTRTLELSAGLLARESDHPPPCRSLPDHPAYVIYTSGSTGRPKGVINTHANVARFLAASWARFGITAEDVWPLFHSFVFDFSVWEIFGPLLSGGRLVMVPGEVVRSPRGFLRLLAANEVTVINQTPAALYQLAAALEEDGTLIPATVRLAFAGGETLDLRRLAAWRARQGDRPRLANVYGITETTVLSTSRWMEDENLEAGPRIGHALSGVVVHLLGPRGERVPLGVHGQIHLGGAGLARGYLGRPELTAERFIPDPFSTQPGARLYRSGDLARRFSDGDLEYLGRIDQQVKVRGFRIELGEVEAALARHPGVRECAADVREVAPGDHGIAAWYVPAAPAERAFPEPAELRAFLETSLPAHMIPAAFTALAALPWMPSGKIDRKALPAPNRAGSGSGSTSSAENAAPRTLLEESLAEMWRDLLGVEQVGREDDFFALGGHSLLATRLISRLRDRLQIEVPPQLVFQTPRLAAMAHALEHVREEGLQPRAPALTAVPRRARRAV